MEDTLVTNSISLVHQIVRLFRFGKGSRWELLSVLLIGLFVATLSTGLSTALAFQQVFELPPDTSNNVSAGFALLSDGSVYGKSSPSAGPAGNLNAPYDGTFWGTPAPFFPTINLGTPVGLFKIDMNDSQNAVGETPASTFPFNLQGFVTENAVTTPVTTTLVPGSRSLWPTTASRVPF